MCSNRLMSTGLTAVRSAVRSPTHGGGRPSSAARTAFERVGRAHDRAVLVEVVDRRDRLGGAGKRDVGGGHDEVLGGADGRVVEVLRDAVLLHLADHRRVLGQVLHRRTARRRDRQNILHVVEDGLALARAPHLLADRRDRRTLVGRRERDHVAERWERAVAGVVVAGEEHVDHEAALRVRDEVDLATGVLPLHRAQLLGEERGRFADRSVRVVLRVATAVARVGEVANLALGCVVAERVDVEIDGGPAVPRRPRAVDPGDDHDAVQGTAGAVGGGRVAAVGGHAVGEAPPDGDEVEGDLAGRRVGERAGGERRERLHRGQGVERRGTEVVERVGREVGGRVEEVDPAVERDAGVVAEPGADVAHRVERVADERQVGVAVVAVGVRTRPARTRDREAEGRLQVTPFPFGRPRGLTRFVGGDEVHELGEVVGPEQLHRVDVAVADAQPEVEHSPIVITDQYRPWRRARRRVPPSGQCGPTPPRGTSTRCAGRRRGRR